MIKYFYGDIGSGKTLSMIFEAEKIRNHFLKKNKKIMVFTNTDYKYKTNELWEIFNNQYQNDNKYKLILFDEIDKYINSRTPSNKLNILLGELIELSRKINSDFIVSAQLFNSLDKRPRALVNEIINPKWYKKAGILKWDIFNNLTSKNYYKKFKLHKEYFYSLYSTTYLTLTQIAEDRDKFIPIIQKLSIKSKMRN